jgi:hypothetical protein
MDGLSKRVKIVEIKPLVVYKIEKNEIVHDWKLISEDIQKFQLIINAS